MFEYRLNNGYEVFTCGERMTSIRYDGYLKYSGCVGGVDKMS